jgi:hypothetical protein
VLLVCGPLMFLRLYALLFSSPLYFCSRCPYKVRARQVFKPVILFVARRGGTKIWTFTCFGSHAAVVVTTCLRQTRQTLPVYVHGADTAPGCRRCQALLTTSCILRVGARGGPRILSMGIQNFIDILLYEINFIKN